MSEEFNLSEKIDLDYSVYDMEGVISTEDVKEFIKQLKEEISNPEMHLKKTDVEIILEEIDKLAGEKLK